MNDDPKEAGNRMKDRLYGWQEAPGDWPPTQMGWMI